MHSPTLEVSGYILLVVAALLNQNSRLIQLNHEVETQSRVVSRQAAELATLNENLEQRVNDQVGEIEKLARLKRFLAPEVAQVVLAEQQESMLESHRSYIVTLFCDIRGFTEFSESMEPEDVNEPPLSAKQRLVTKKQVKRPIVQFRHASVAVLRITRYEQHPRAASIVPHCHRIPAPVARRRGVAVRTRCALVRA